MSRMTRPEHATGPCLRFVRVVVVIVHKGPIWIGSSHTVATLPLSIHIRQTKHSP
jgi:hypothetical protein